MLNLLQDDRFLRNADALKNELNTDAGVTRGLPMYVFERIAMSFSTGRFEAASLRHDSIHAMLVGLGYLEREAFALLKCPPFCWTQGNLINNIADIRGLANPLDVATRKLKIMLGCGVTDAVVVSTLELIRDAPCSVALCEKTHGAGSLLARAHGLYSSDKLALRSLVCSARPIFTLSKVSSKEAKLRAELDKNHALARYSARNEFCSRAILDDVNGLQCGGEKKRRSRAGIADHNARFDALPMEEQRIHARAAEDVRKRKVREQEAARQGIRDALATLLADDEAARGQRQGICNQVSSCRLSDDELLTMCKIYEEFAAGRRQRPPLFLRAPTIPDADLQGFIEEKAKDLCGPWRPLVSPGGVLQRVICKERKHFVDTCFAFEFNEHNIADHIFVFFCLRCRTHWPLCS